MPCPGVAAEDRPAAASDLVRVFRFNAGAEAEALCDAAGRADVDEKLRKELLGLMRDHLARVDEEAKRVAAARDMSADEVMRRAAELARSFNEGTVARWLDDHPDAFPPVQEQVSLVEAYQRALSGDAEAVVRCAKAAGLEAGKEQEVRRLVTEAQQSVRRLRQDADRRIASPAPKAPAPAADKPPAPAADKAPEPDLVDLATGAEFQTKATAAARGLRDGVEKLLPGGNKREAMKVEMLRWLDSTEPDDPAAPPAKDRKADDARPEKQPAR